MASTFAQRFPVTGHSASARPVEVPWLVDGVLLRGKINLVLGPEKSGKSRLLCWLLAQMMAEPLAANAPVLQYDGGVAMANHHGFQRVLYLNAEEMTVDVQARLNAYARRLGMEPSDDWPIDYLNAASMQLEQVAERRALEAEYLATGKYDVVVIDPWRRVHAGDENNNSAMAPLHNDLRKWSNRYGLTFVVVHHSPKFREEDDLERIATWCRGATDLATLCDGAMCMRTVASGADRTMRVMKRMGRFPPQSDLLLIDRGEPQGFAVQWQSKSD